MNRARLLKLFWEFEAKLTELHTWYLDSLVGYVALHERLNAHRENLRTFLNVSEFSTDEFQNTLGISYRDISKFSFSPESMSPVMKQGALLDRVKKDGRNALILGQQCLVAVYSYWEDYYREELEKALGQAINCDLWGDIRIIRNSIIHANGIAKANVAKCKIITWFKPGDVINLDYEKMESIFIHMAKFRNEVHALSLPPAAVIQL